MLPLVEVQVSVNDVPAVTFGFIKLSITVTVAVFVQPLPGSVTTTVYVPVAFAVGAAVLFPEIIPLPLQTYVAPGVVELTLIDDMEEVHVIVDADGTETFGGVVF